MTSADEAPPEPRPLIRLVDAARTFSVGGEAVHALDHVALTFRAGEHAAVVGPSGSGKTTLMNLLGLLDTPSSGEYVLDGVHTASLNPRQRSRLRNRMIGLIFQQYHLLPQLTAVQNAELAMLYRGVAEHAARDAARQALETVGLAARLDHLPHQLSGGERQRVAIARALAGRPLLMLADEPTGALDGPTGMSVLQLLRDTATSTGCALIVVTHDPGVAARLPRRIEMRDGRVVADGGSHG